MNGQSGHAGFQNILTRCTPRATPESGEIYNVREKWINQSGGQ